MEDSLLEDGAVSVDLSQYDRTARSDVDEEEDGYGAGGILRPSKRHPFGFVVLIDRKRATFELSLVDDPSIFHGLDEVDAARRFEEHRVDFERFLNDPSVVQDSKLVLRWSGDQ